MSDGISLFTTRDTLSNEKATESFEKSRGVTENPRESRKETRQHVFPGHLSLRDEFRTGLHRETLREKRTEFHDFFLRQNQNELSG